MSTCTVCQKDSKKHSKKLWEMHKQVTICVFCDKSSVAHREELWERHKETVEAAKRKTRHLGENQIAVCPQKGTNSPLPPAPFSVIFLQ